MAGKRIYMVIEHDRRDREWCDGSKHRPGEAGTPLKAFTDYAKAEAFLKERELAARKKANPFAHGSAYRGIGEVSHFDADRFHDWLLDAGIEPPASSRGEKFTLVKWAKWWRRAGRGLTEAQVAKVWEATDKVRFYSILEFDEP